MQPCTIAWIRHNTWNFDGSTSTVHHSNTLKYSVGLIVRLVLEHSCMGKLMCLILFGEMLLEKYISSASLRNNYWP